MIPLLVAGAAIIFYFRSRRKKQVAEARARVTESEAQIIVNRLYAGGLSDEDRHKLFSRLTDAGYKIVGGRAVKV